MAVYTEVGDDTLKRFLADYDLGRPLALKGIAEGVENSNYLVETGAGRFILTLALAALALFGAWSWRHQDLASTAPNNARQTSDARAFDMGEPAPAIQQNTPSPTSEAGPR